MIRHWSLIVADFRREYHMTADELCRLDASEFRMLLAGLSSEARFADAWHRTPRIVRDPNEIAAITAAARR